MDHLTNLYKHKCEQLQEQLYNLTRMLNEAVPPGVIRRIPDIDGPGGNGPGGPGRFIPNGPDGNPRGYGTNNPTIDPAEIARREAAELARQEAATAAAAAAAAAHLAAVRAMMGTLLHDLRMLPHGSWSQMYNEVFTALEREAFIALFGSANPPILLGSISGLPAQFIRYMTPNGEWVVMYNHAVVSGHPRWLPVIKGITPFGLIDDQGFLIVPTRVPINNPEDIFSLRPDQGISTTPGGKPSGGGGSIGGGGGGLGSQTGNPM